MGEGEIMRFPILGPAIFFNGLYLLLYPASSRRRCCWHIGGEIVSMYTVSNSDCATTLDGGGGARCDDDFALRRKKWWLRVSKREEGDCPLLFGDFCWKPPPPQTQSHISVHGGGRDEIYCQQDVPKNTLTQHSSIFGESSLRR